VSGFSQPVFKGPAENLGPQVNDRFNQVQPIFSTDGETLYFSNGSGQNQLPEIWKTITDSLGRITGKEKIKALNPNIAQPKYVLQSLNSRQLLVNGNYAVYNNRLTYYRGISLFTQPVSTEFSPELFQKKSSKALDSLFRKNNFYPFYHPFLNVYCWSQGDENQQDIFLLIPETGDNNPARVIKLPAAVNSGFNDITPWMDDEGRYLYFASNRPGGFGETDIYVSERLDGSYENWSAAKNLGPAVNGPKADFNFIIDPVGAYGYFASERPGFGGTDLYRVAILQPDSSTSPLLLPSDKPDTTIIFKPGIHAPNNITFLLDISHSMAQSRKMVLLKKSLYSLVRQLRATDKVSIVVFGTGIETLLSGQPAKNKAEIMDAVQSLHANGGATNIGAGLQRAYEQSRQFFSVGANNQLFVITDGVFSLKTADEQRIKNNADILLTAVQVGNDAQTNRALQTLTTLSGGQFLLIKNESNDINQLLQNVRNNAAAKTKQ